LGELIAAAMGSGAHTVLILGALRKMRTVLIFVNCKTPSFPMPFIFVSSQTTWSQTIATSQAPMRWQSATSTTASDRMFIKIKSNGYAIPTKNPKEIEFLLENI
jgi:hypothetical protein